MIRSYGSKWERKQKRKQWKEILGKIYGDGKGFILDKDTREAIEIIADTLGGIELQSPIGLSDFIGANRKKLYKIIVHDKED